MFSAFPSVWQPSDTRQFHAKGKAAYPLLVIRRWSWHKWWKGPLQIHEVRDTEERDATLKIHEIPILLSQMLSLSIYPACTLLDYRTAFIVEFVNWHTHVQEPVHTYQSRNTPLPRAFVCGVWLLLSAVVSQPPTITTDKSSAVTGRPINDLTSACSLKVSSQLEFIFLTLINWYFI